MKIIITTFDFTSLESLITTLIVNIIIINMIYLFIYESPTLLL